MPVPRLEPEAASADRFEVLENTGAIRPLSAGLELKSKAGGLTLYKASLTNALSVHLPRE